MTKSLRFERDQIESRAIWHLDAMEETECLRRLIAQYRHRLAQGESADMTIFCIRAIREAELKLAAIAKR
jgi:hypothetical protein